MSYNKIIMEFSHRSCMGDAVPQKLLYPLPRAPSLRSTEPAGDLRSRKDGRQQVIPAPSVLPATRTAAAQQQLYHQWL